MRIFASLVAPNANPPKAPYDGFFECVSFQWGGEFNSAGNRPAFKQTDSKLVHQIDPVSADFFTSLVAQSPLDLVVLYERAGTRAPFVYLTVTLTQSLISALRHEQVAGGALIPFETLTIIPTAITGRFYDESGSELGRTSFGST